LLLDRNSPQKWAANGEMEGWMDKSSIWEPLSWEKGKGQKKGLRATNAGRYEEGELRRVLNSLQRARDRRLNRSE